MKMKGKEFHIYWSLPFSCFQTKRRKANTKFWKIQKRNTRDRVLLYVERKFSKRKKWEKRNQFAAFSKNSKKLKDENHYVKWSKRIWCFYDVLSNILCFTHIAGITSWLLESTHFTVSFFTIEEDSLSLYSVINRERKMGVEYFLVVFLFFR